jgi:hypothetical protein
MGKGFFHKGRRKGAVVLYLRRTPKQFVGDLESQAFRRRHCRVQAHGCDGRRDNIAEGHQRIRNGRRDDAFFSLAASYPSGGGPGSSRKKGGARRGLRHDGRASEEKRRKKKDSELWKKRRGTNRLYT